MKRIVIGDNGHNERCRGRKGVPVWIVVKRAPAAVGETVRVAWKDENGIEEGGEYTVVSDSPTPHGNRETWRSVCLRKKMTNDGRGCAANDGRGKAANDE